MLIEPSRLQTGTLKRIASCTITGAAMQMRGLLHCLASCTLAVFVCV